MEEWIIATFPVTMPNGDHIIYRGTSTDGAHTWDYVIGYNPVNAAIDFNGVSSVPTHAVLSDFTLATKGNWQRIFDDWKARGLIN